jgi:hypothetical protein
VKEGQDSVCGRCVQFGWVGDGNRHHVETGLDAFREHGREAGISSRAVLISSDGCPHGRCFGFSIHLLESGVHIPVVTVVVVALQSRNTAAMLCEAPVTVETVPNVGPA